MSSENFQLVDLQDQPKIITQITNLEKLLEEELGAKVSLIAYVNSSDRRSQG